MKTTIYETRGRAKEFCELAMNHYSGCGHGCVYCYGPDIVHRDRQDWYKHPEPRLTPVEVENGIYEWKGEKKPVLLCFVTDPYQPIDEEWRLTRFAIRTLNAYGFPVHILTKAGLLAQRDFDLLKLRPDNAFATTLTSLDLDHQRQWEPNAGSPGERMINLDLAYRIGIPTWVSLEPVIDPDWTLNIIERVVKIAGHFKIGTLNYHPKGKEIDWAEFGSQAIGLCERLGARYYIKKDLAKYLGYSEGFWGGHDVD